MFELKITPAISIIVPVYKAEKYLSVCLDSILSQTFTDFELILVNDGSPDSSGLICDAYAKKDPRVYVIHTDHGGASFARNTGVKASRGKYIGWVDADDHINPIMYEKLHSAAESYNADITECQFIKFTRNQTIRSGKPGVVVIGRGAFILTEFFTSRMKAGLLTKLYKRELWDGIIFPQARKHQDCYINLRFALMPLVYVRIPEPYYYHIERENSITTTYTSLEIREAIYLYEYTMGLAANKSISKHARKYLCHDAINRMMGRYCTVTLNSYLRNQNVYNYYIRKTLKSSLIKYLFFAELPFKTRISYILLIFSLKKLQIKLDRLFGKKEPDSDQLI